MRELKITICEMKENGDIARRIAAENHVKIGFCANDPFELQAVCLTEKPDAVVFESSEIIRAAHRLADMDIATNFYMLSTDETHAFAPEIAQSGRLHYVGKRAEKLDLIARIKLDSLDLIAADHAEEIRRTELVKSLIQTALAELCVTRKYSGSEYIECAVGAFCAGEMDRSAAMTKHVYPYLSELFGSTPCGIERSIRTAIGHGWAQCGQNERVKYFGLAFLNSEKAPTNKEFILMLAYYINREVRRREVM